MTENIDSLLSALRLQAPGPGFAARTVLAFERARQARRMRMMLLQLCAAALVSVVGAVSAYAAGWFQPAVFALKAGLVVADAAMVVRTIQLAATAAPVLWGSVLALMAMISIASTFVLERSLRWAK